jgi:hypothetical protein
MLYLRIASPELPTNQIIAALVITYLVFALIVLPARRIPQIRVVYIPEQKLAVKA